LVPWANRVQEERRLRLIGSGVDGDVLGEVREPAHVVEVEMGREDPVQGNSLRFDDLRVPC